MAKNAGSGFNRSGFSDKIRNIVAEKGTRAAAEKFGRSEKTIRSWASGTSAPNKRDAIIDKVNRSYAAQKPRWEPEQHREKVVRVYGDENTVRTGSVLKYMKLLDTEFNLSTKAKEFFLQQHEEGNVVTWRGNTVMPVSDVRIIPAMSNPTAPSSAGATAFGLTNSYYTGHKGKHQERVRGIVTQTIDRAVYKTKGRLHLNPDKMTPDQMHSETKRIHLTSKVNKQRLPAIYLGYGDRE